MVENLLDAIRVATNADATPESRAAGATACRTILAALEGTAGAPAKPVGINPAELAKVVAALRGVPSDQLLDLAIKKLQGALPAGAQVPNVRPLAFHIVPVPRG
jgi:hypothetical protein